MYRTPIYSLLWALTSLASLAYAKESEEKYSAESLLKSTQELHCREESTITRNDGKLVRLQSKYYSSKGTLIAELKSDFSKNPYLPESDFIDHRVDYSYTVRLDEKAAKVEVAHRDRKDKSWEKSFVDFKPDLMTLQGALAYVADHMSELSKVDEKLFRFLVPSRASDYGVKIARLPADETSGLTFKMKMQSALLRLVAPDFEAKFDDKKKRIVEFDGVSNILDDKRQIQKVVVHYKYQD
jgi:hypothetical protein